jgi:hypothetical protein
MRHVVEWPVLDGGPGVLMDDVERERGASDVVARPNGNNSYRNVVAASREINNRKGAMTADKFLRKLFRDGLLSASELDDRFLKLARKLARSSPISSIFVSHKSIFPKPLEPFRTQLRIAHGVRDVAVPEVMLNGAGVVGGGLNGSMQHLLTYSGHGGGANGAARAMEFDA